MRTVLARAAVLAATLLVVLPMAASAEVDDHAAEAATTSVRLSVFENQVGSPVLDLIGTDAFSASDPTASASVDAIEVFGEQLFEIRSAESDGEPVRDPEEGEGCVVPAEVTGLTLRAVCGVAAADAGDVTTTSAAATTQLLDLGVNGSLLAGALTTPLGDFVATAGDLVVEGAIDEFLAQCNELIAQAEEEAPEELTGTARDLLAMTPDELDPAEQTVSEIFAEGGGEACSAVFNLHAHSLSEEVLDVSGIAAALEGLELLTVRIDGASSTIAGSDAALDATARQVTLRITGLEDLADLDAAIVAVVEAIRAEVEEIAGGGEPLPLPEDFSLQDAFDAIPLFGIEGPLVEGTIDGGSATAALTVDDGATTSGGTEPSVTLTLAPGLLELFGADPEQGTQTFTAGQSQTMAEGTPLESSISVGTLTTEDGVTFEDTDLTGSTATASVTEVALLSGVEGGINLVLSESSAGAYGAMPTAAAPDPDPEDPLPNTGGSAAVAAVLALGVGAALRRRRD